jgi:hypothetical protein
MRVSRDKKDNNVVVNHIIQNILIQICTKLHYKMYLICKKLEVLSMSALTCNDK